MATVGDRSVQDEPQVDNLLAGISQIGALLGERFGIADRRPLQASASATWPSWAYSSFSVGRGGMKDCQRTRAQRQEQRP